MSGFSDLLKPAADEPAGIVPSTLTSAQPPGSPTASDPKELAAVGSYRLLRRIGAGEFGEVWRAQAPGGTEVAIKILKRSIDAAEAQQELQALEKVKLLRHRYLAQTHAFWIKDERLHIVLDLADSSLNDRARQCREQGLEGIPVAELLGYFKEAAEALDFLHSEHVLHRDIKPANILLLRGHAMLADFGLARSMPADVSQIVGTWCGTPGYMAPEVWHNQFSNASDQWSLAAAYAELRLNRRVFTSLSLPDLMTEICGGRIDLSPLQDAEQQVLCKALAKDPHQRYPTCMDFVQALEKALRPTPPPPPSPRPWGRIASISAVALLACLVAAGIGLYPYLNPPIVVPPPIRIWIDDPKPVQVATGHEIVFPLHIRRQNFDGKLRIACVNTDLPPHVTIAPQVIGEGEQEAEIHVAAAPEAARDTYKIRLKTDEGSPAAEAVLKLTILYLPPHFETDGEVAADDKNVQYFKRISRTLDGMRVPFVLIPQKTRQEPETFYIMQDKVSLGLFRKFAELFPKEVQSNKWKEGTDDRDPVLFVTVDEAHRFASLWLHGRLPSIQQWDKAAGRYEIPQGEGPYRGSWQDIPKPAIAVGRPTPVAIGSFKSDISPFGCRDMAGNGYEWTRTLKGGKGEVPISKPRATEHVVYLRGHSFNEPEPLRYDDLVETNPGLSCPYVGTPEEPVGFRVVIEP